MLFRSSAQASLGSIAVLDLDYEDGVLWVLAEDRLVTVSETGAVENPYLFGRSYLKGCNFGGDGYAFILLGRYRAGSATQALVIGPDGSANATLNLWGQVLDFSSAGGYCSLLTGNGLTIYTHQLQPYATLSSTQGARYTALSSDGSALLADAQQAWLYIPN